MGGINTRRLLGAILVIGGILAGSLYSSYWLTGLTGDIIGVLEQAETLVESGDWSGAAQRTTEVSHRWDSVSFPLHALLRHTETDQIWVSLHQVLEHLEQRDEMLYASANAQLITQLELLAEMEHPSWENVL